MREYEVIIDEALIKGLSPEGALPINSQFLYKCYGFRVGKVGLEPYILLDNPVPHSVDMHYVWPFPQVLSGERYNFLVVRDLVNDEDAVYLLSDDMNTVTHVFSVDYLIFGKGTLFDAADFGEWAILTDGVCMIYWNIAGAWNATTGTPDIPLMGTLCNFKGQIVGGNVKQDWYDCDETFYLWSKIGYASFIPDKENEAGYRRCPYGGQVLHTRRLGDIVIGYSTEGIIALTPVSDPAVTFGFTELEATGLLNKGAIAGGVNEHLFVGTDYRLRRVTQEGVEELGFKYLLQQMTGDIVINYEPSNKDYYISDGIISYVLSPYGMSEIPQHPSAVWRRSGTTYCIPDIDDEEESIITSWPFDLGYAGQKTVFTTEISANGFEGAEAKVDSLTRQNWQYGSYSPINYQGIATTIAAGDAFRFGARFKALEDSFKISHIKARFKMTDLRGIRGIYAPPPRGQIS